MENTTNLFEQKFKSLFKPLPDIEFDKEELKMGIETELEHTENREIATIIAKQHLAEDPKYYSKLKKVHSEDENTVGGGALGPAAAVGHNALTNTDWYAPGDYRIPLGRGTYSRRGKVKTSKKKQRRKSKKKK